jgi:hypothetical protein
MLPRLKWLLLLLLLLACLTACLVPATGARPAQAHAGDAGGGPGAQEGAVTANGVVAVRSRISSGSCAGPVATALYVP